jgi:hypothetical protein
MTTTADRFEISCPNGHPVQVPAGLTGRELRCPRCSEPVLADPAESVEAQEAQIERAARQWLWLAVATALLLATMALGLFFAGVL